MEKLKQVIQSGRKSKTYPDWFKEIAQELMLHYQITTGDARYWIKEIEFYYYDEAYHPDPSVYGIIKNQHKEHSRIFRHKQRQHKPFTWFIHYSGIDIVFGEQGKPGGILIRSLEKISETDKPNEMITGPLVVLLELMNQSTSIFDAAPFELKLIEADTSLSANIKSTVRVGLGNSDYKGIEYNYSIES